MSKKIVLMVEGATEKAFLPSLREFLSARLGDRPKPRIDTHVYDGRIPTGQTLRRHVQRLLTGKAAADAVIALTDVYTGTREFADATDAKRKMRQWVGEDEPRFFPHVALHDFEAWLLPYWPIVQSLAGSNRKPPASDPEAVNHNKPPAYHLREVFRTGSAGRTYVKPRDAARILRGQDLEVATRACPELKALLDTVLHLCQER